jgi:hypothetical protein
VPSFRREARLPLTRIDGVAADLEQPTLVRTTGDRWRVSAIVPPSGATAFFGRKPVAGQSYATGPDGGSRGKAGTDLPIYCDAGGVVW